MKSIIKNPAYLIIAIMVSMVFFSCKKNSTLQDDVATPGNMDITRIQSSVNSLPSEPLNSHELASLKHIREEEKLARDVYKKMYSKWGANIFNNISSSEQTHMDAVLVLLNKYQIPDPVANNAPGVFADQNLQALYNELVAFGNTSVLNAYKTGATIEDMDIYDIQEDLLYVDNQDIKLVYESLSKGSRNHLRNFYKFVLSNGGTYTAQYITQTEFDAIVNSPMETGP